MLPDYTDWRQLVASIEEWSLPKTHDSNQSRIFLIVDDHDAILQCLIPLLKKNYPAATLLAAQDYQSALSQLKQLQKEQRLIALAILDLELPKQLGDIAQSEIGLSLLDLAIHHEQVGSILALGESVKPLRRFKSKIYSYKAGFGAVTKAQPMASVLKMIDLALTGSIHLPIDVRSQTEFNEKWATVLRLKYQDGLSDRAISERLGVSPRTIRSYWPNIQDKLGVYDNPTKDVRVQIEQAARQAGLIS